MNVHDRLDKIQARADAATEGPWSVGDRWHIQGASHCDCLPQNGPHIREQVMNINGEMMLAHIHEREKPWYSHGITTEPWEDGHPRWVVYTTGEYGHMAPEDERFIATSRTDVPMLVDALRAVLDLHPPIAHHRIAANGEVAEHFEACEECDWVRWPCPTVRAIESALREES